MIGIAHISSKIFDKIGGVSLRTILSKPRNPDIGIVIAHTIITAKPAKPPNCGDEAIDVLITHIPQMILRRNRVSPLHANQGFLMFGSESLDMIGFYSI